MTKENQNVTVVGASFFSLLTLLFIGLKLTNYIDWSWWWVLAPLWMPLTLVFMFLLIFIGALIAKGIRK
jgi:ABC-type multidrug transport system permease subunit